MLASRIGCSAGPTAGKLRFLTSNKEEIGSPSFDRAAEGLPSLRFESHSANHSDVMGKGREREGRKGEGKGREGKEKKERKGK